MRNTYLAGRMYKIPRPRQFGLHDMGFGGHGSITREQFLKRCLGVRKIPEELVKKK